MPLLEAHEPSPVLLHRADGNSPFLLAADHAGRLLPRRLGTLGLPRSELDRHIAYDIGIWGVTRALADLLDATAIGQAYSRLVIDCNRSPDWPTAFPAISESTPVPGNAALDDAARAERRREIFDPYHDQLARLLAARRDAGAVVLVAMHSFTPVYRGVARPWHAGVLFGPHDRLSRAMLDLLRGEAGLVVGENEPYALAATSDYAVPTHAWAHATPYLELEIRQDLIAEPGGQQDWAARLARLLPAAWRAAQA